MLLDASDTEGNRTDTTRRVYRLQQVTENEQHRSINLVADSKCYKDPSWGGDPE